MFEEFIGDPRRIPSRELEELAHHAQVLTTGQVLIHCCVLARQSDTGPHPIGLFHHIEPIDPCSTGVGDECRREHSDRRGLTRSVGTEKAQHRAPLDRETHTVESSYLTPEDLHQTVGLDRCSHDPITRGDATARQ